DTRAHGRSGGELVGIGYSEQKDVRAVLAMLRQRYPDKKFVLVGSSMGSVACLYTARYQPLDVQGMVLDAPYATLADAVKGWWAFCGIRSLALLLGPVAGIGSRMAGINLAEVRPIDLMDNMNGTKILLLTGDRDPIATPINIESMSKKAGKNSSFHVFKECTHGQIRAKYAYEFRDLLDRFLVEL
ncbi:MAG: alpha/beta fold hydrolase, partial [bacterium]